MADRGINWLRRGKIVCSIAAIILGLLLIVTEDRMTTLVAGVITTLIGLISLGLDMVIWRKEDAEFAPVKEHWEKNKWRELSAEQREGLISEFQESRTIQNGVVVAIYFLSGNAESNNFAKQIFNTFIEAGWENVYMEFIWGGSRRG